MLTAVVGQTQKTTSSEPAIRHVGIVSGIDSTELVGSGQAPGGALPQTPEMERVSVSQYVLCADSDLITVSSNSKPRLSTPPVFQQGIHEIQLELTHVLCESPVYVFKT